jgi:hypothetical protein
MDATPTPAASTPLEATAAARPRRFGRRFARRVSLLRDVLASVKDGGLILIVLALLFFHDDVIDSLQGLGLGRVSTVQAIDVQETLARLSLAADRLTPTVQGVPPAPPKPKVLRAERRLLSSAFADDIDDWAVVAAVGTDRADAERLRGGLLDIAPEARLAERQGRWRVVVPRASAQDVQAALNRLRLRHPGAVAVSLAAWCDPDPSATDRLTCRRR